MATNIVTRIAAVGLLTVGLAVTGCASDPQTSDTSSPSPTAAAADFPVDVESCAETLTFDQAPERILLLSETDFSILHDLGLADRVVAKAGNRRIDDEFPELNEALDAIPSLEAGDTGTGGAKVSTEAALSVKPDVVFGYDEGADREKLAASGVPLYSPDAMCPGYTTDHASFDLVDAEIDKVAAMFGVPDEAAEVKAKVAERLEEVEKNAPEEAQASAAALFVMPGTTQFYSYGTSSMVQPIFEVNGLSNVFDDRKERVFEASMEALLEHDPEWLVLMADSSTPEEAEQILLTYPGAEGLQAVEKDQVVYLPFVLTDPPTTLSVDGAVRLGELLER